MSTIATFQCSLCPKRFTRAFNLRSHLRVHTDERPFVCSVCGKAFARHHDRKSHEALHTGEKKFACQGDLEAGGSWGCGRRFAQAKNLGRHLRSETGRACTLPLIMEEANRKQQQPPSWALEMLRQQSHQLSEHSAADQSIARSVEIFQPEFNRPAALMSATPQPSRLEPAFRQWFDFKDHVLPFDDEVSLTGPSSGKAGDELQWTVHSRIAFGGDVDSFTLWFGNATVPAMRTSMGTTMSNQVPEYEHTIQAIVPLQRFGQTGVPLMLTFEHISKGKFVIPSFSYFTYSLHSTFAAASTAGRQATAASDLDPLDPAAQVDLLKGALQKAGIELGALLRGEIIADMQAPTKAKSCRSCRRSKLRCCRLYSDGPGPCDRCVSRNLSCVR